MTPPSPWDAFTRVAIAQSVTCEAPGCAMVLVLALGAKLFRYCWKHMPTAANERETDGHETD